MPELVTPTAMLIVWGVVGYLLGSIPSGIVMARLMGLGNLRDIGSGNIGATNVLRTGNKKAAALTLIFDALKGAIAVLLARAMAGEDAAQLAGLMAIIGHCLPVWLKFQGGKGVATYLGVILALSPVIGALACVIWLIVAAIGRYSSLASLATAGWLPIVMGLTGYGDMFYLGVALAVFIYIRHRSNISRLRAGTETKIGAKS